jgi:thiopurine S-methyltransferase
MDPAFWIERWEKQQIGFHQQTINPYLVTYWGELAVPRNAPVFVPMCGKSRDMQWLRHSGHPVIGVEIARTAVRDFFEQLALAPQVTEAGSLERWEAGGYTLWCGDLFALTAAQLTGVSGVFDRASLIALPAAMRQGYVRHMSAIVPSSAATLLVSLMYPQQEMKGPPLSVDEREIHGLYSQYRVDKLADINVLTQPENARFFERGLTAMSEQVYRLKRH